MTEGTGTAVRRAQLTVSIWRGLDSSWDQQRLVVRGADRAAAVVVFGAGAQLAHGRGSSYTLVGPPSYYLDQSRG